MFRNPFSFKGRIRRAEYVISIIIYIILLLIIQSFQENLIDSIVKFDKGVSLFYFTYLLYIPILWFLIAQNTKRCHDIGKSGFYQFIPFYTLWLIFAEGDSGSNQYGEDPLKDVINKYINRQAFYNQYDDNLNLKSQEISHSTLETQAQNEKIKVNKTNLHQNIKKLKILEKLNSIKLSSDEIIIVSLIVGIVISLLFGCIFGETIYYFDNGTRGSLKEYDFSEFHLSYIALIASFIVTTGITYILLNRKNGEK